MKKIIAFMMIISLTSAAIFSQSEDEGAKEEVKKVVTENKSSNEDTGLEIFTGYGYLTANSVLFGFGAAFAEVFGAIGESIAESASGNENGEEEKDKTKKESNFNDFGVFQIGANWYFSENFYAGLSGTYQGFTMSDKHYASAISFLANAGVQYGWERAKFYHEIGAGLLLTAGSKDVTPLFCMNFTLLGFKFSPADNFWLFAETALGQKGIINLGARWRL